jgi:hypothetical protein
MTRPHEYVDCDLPDGMTLREYHAARRATARKRPRRSIVARLQRRRARRRAAATRA